MLNAKANNNCCACYIGKMSLLICMVLLTPIWNLEGDLDDQMSVSGYVFSYSSGYFFGIKRSKILKWSIRTPLLRLADLFGRKYWSKIYLVFHQPTLTLFLVPIKGPTNLQLIWRSYVRTKHFEIEHHFVLEEVLDSIIGVI